MLSQRPVFHKGELKVQEISGEHLIAARNGTLIKDEISSNAISFLSQQRMLVVGTVDMQFRPWSSIFFGEAGFISILEDGTKLEIDLSRSFIDQRDLMWSNLKLDSHVGILAIEFDTRRRFRVGGRASWESDTIIEVVVEESLGLCPKYIQRRQLKKIEPNAGRGKDVDTKLHVAKELSKQQMDLIRSADTFFLSTFQRDNGVDISHRGGEPGFVEVLSHKTLRIPDYSGNSLFNSLGNLMLWPLAGLLFLDFATGNTLQLSGKATLLFHQDDATNRTGGTGRFWEYEIENVHSWRPCYTADWEFIDASPFNPK